MSGSSPAIDATVLSPGEVHVWRASLELDGAITSALGRTLSGEERRRASRFHREADQARFAAAKGLLRALLAQYLGVDAADLTFVRDEHGKPRLDGSAAWLRFNLSHSGDVLVVAAARDREVGVDVEQVRHDLSVRDVAGRFLSAGDNAALDAVPSALRESAFFAAWTRREAYLKARGVGLGGGGDRSDPDPASWTVAAVDVGPGSAAAVAVEGAGVLVPAAARPFLYSGG